MPSPVLHLVCGKIASGKSTLAHRLASAPGTILIGEDDWLSRLYPGAIATLEDYVRCSGHLRDVLGPHAVALLGAGLSVVLDFPANTVRSRQWMRGIIERAGTSHVLHHVDVPDAICKERLRHRNAAGTHAYDVSETDFELFTSYFVPPAPEEGFTVVVHEP
jgi:predicted kinase